MTDTAAPVLTGGEAQPIAVANSIDTIVDDAVKENSPQPQEVEDTAKPEGDKPKELSPAEELEKLRRAKSRDDKRIGKLTAIKYQALKEAEDLRAELSKYKQPTAQSPDNRPKEADFKNYADYLEAVNNHNIEKKFAEYSGKDKQTQQDIKEQAWVNERSTAVDKMADEFAKQTPELPALFDEYADVIREYPKELKHALLGADNPPLAFYNLAKEGKLEDLASMSLVDAKVEIRLAQMKPVEKPKTKAPAPLPASRGSVAPSKQLDGMSGDELRSWLRSAN